MVEAVTDEIERGNAVVIAGDGFAIDDAGARAQACQRLDDQREAMEEIVARTGVEAHPWMQISTLRAWRTVDHWNKCAANASPPIDILCAAVNCR
jgi:hypothetical protein